MTGGFLKPYIWFLYLIGLTFLFALIYMSIPGGFVSTADPTATTLIALDFQTALQYSALRTIDSNTLPIACTGLSQIISAIHAALNTTIIANFFATVIKKYMND